jgi:hypothetical protein
MLLVLCLAVAIDLDPPWPEVHEISRGMDGILTAVSNSSVPYGRLNMSFLVPEEAEESPYIVGGVTLEGPWSHESIDFGRIAGPLAWGVVDGSWYTVAHSRPGRGDYQNAEENSPWLIESWTAQTSIVATPHPMAEEIESQRYNRSRSWPDDRRVEIPRIRMMFAADHGCYCKPLVEYIKDNTWPLFRNWDLAFDLVYTSLDQVTAAAVHRGQLMVWELDGTGDLHAEWTALELVDTQIQGAFRVLRAGPDLKNLYFIDSTGNIFTGFGADHRKIGTIAFFDAPRENAVGLLFEDQQEQKIGVFDVALGGGIITLDIDWLEEGFATDFYSSLEDERLKTHLTTMATILQEHQQQTE